MNEETFIRIKVGWAETKPTLVKSGLRQGDSMSPIVFKLILNKVVRETNIKSQEEFKLQESTLAVLAYSADVVLDLLESEFPNDHLIYSIGGLYIKVRI